MHLISVAEFKAYYSGSHIWRLDINFVRTKRQWDQQLALSALRLVVLHTVYNHVFSVNL
jgi:hypothetical protein